MSSSTESTSADKKPTVARVAFCSSAADTPPIPNVAVASLRNTTWKSLTMASRAVVSQQTFVVTPEIMTVSMPRVRRINSRSVERAESGLVEKNVLSIDGQLFMESCRWGAFVDDSCFHQWDHLA